MKQVDTLTGFTLNLVVLDEERSNENSSKQMRHHNGGSDIKNGHFCFKHYLVTCMDPFMQFNLMFVL